MSGSLKKKEMKRVISISNPQITALHAYSMAGGSTLMAAMQRNRSILNNAMEETLLAVSSKINQFLHTEARFI